MAPKRFKKNEVNENTEKYKNLVIEDVLCPICRSIFVEPVTLPCSHGFCLSCFNGTMENNALTCPLCRIRIGSWLRTARKEKKVINDRLWQIIQLKFSKEVKNKLDGEDEIPEESLCIKLANPGEIRREYEIELQKQRSELAKQHEAEERASEVIIRKILHEEQSVARMQEEKLRLDGEIARRLSNTISESGPSSSQITTKTLRKPSLDKYLVPLHKKYDSNMETKNTLCKSANTDIHSQTNAHKNYTAKIMFQSRGKKQCSHAYKHLLLTKTLQYERANSNGSDSGDSINQEMRYFKPIRTAPKSVPKIYGDGNIVRAPLLKVPSVHAVTAVSVTIRAPQIDKVVRIISHSRSAFVGCGSGVSSTSAVDSPLKQTTAVSDTGKTIKQYYNKKKNAMRASSQHSPISSPETSPCFGFLKDYEAHDALVMRGIVTAMSASVKETSSTKAIDQTFVEKSAENTGNTGSSIANARVRSTTEANILKPPKKKLLERSLKKVNGCDTEHILGIGSNDMFVTTASECACARAVHLQLQTQREPTPAPAPQPELTPADLRLQEQLDFEYAKRLHEELNNPRTRAFMTLKASSTQTRTKRQVTLDELIPPKKFKI